MLEAVQRCFCFTDFERFIERSKQPLLQVLMLVAVRKVMEKIFTLYELEVLDDLMPENIKKQKAELEAKKKKEENFEYDDEDNDDDSDSKKVCGQLK